MKKIIVAIDGFSSTGKSSMARQLAKRLGYTFIDSGAMYRAITLYLLREQIDWQDHEQVAKALASIRLNFDAQNRIVLNNEVVADEIRTLQVSQLVSEVSAIEAVRIFAVAQQQAMGRQKGLVMDGRDIGTAVFPHAELKIYLTADRQVRVQRRYQELKQTNASISLEEVAENLAHRDHLDATRAISPLRQATDAVVIDNSNYTLEQTIQVAYDLALRCIETSG